MKVQLDTPNPAIDSENLDEINTNNVKKIQNTLNKTGINQLLIVDNVTATNFTSATLTQLLTFTGIVTSSGGWIEVNFKVNAQVTGDFVGQLLIDGIVKDSFLISGAPSNDNVTLAWRGNLGIGRHSITVNAAVTILAIISNSSSMTRLQVVEFLF